jgi:hypothetical protein
MMTQRYDDKQKACGGCRHFKANLENLAEGACIKRPPMVVSPAPGHVATFFPAIQRTDRCGEHEPASILTEA